MESQSNISIPALLANPIKARYAEMLDSESDILEAIGLTYSVGAYGAGIQYFQDKVHAAVRMSTLQGQIVGGYFDNKDFGKVYPNYEPETLSLDLSYEFRTIQVDNLLPLLYERKVIIHQVCEEHDWWDKKFGPMVIPTDTTKASKERPAIKPYATTLPP